jgi:hypothetical protein
LIVVPKVYVISKLQPDVIKYHIFAVGRVKFVKFVLFAHSNLGLFVIVDYDVKLEIFSVPVKLLLLKFKYLIAVPDIVTGNVIDVNKLLFVIFTIAPICDILDKSNVVILLIVIFNKVILFTPEIYVIGNNISLIFGLLLI